MMSIGALLKELREMGFNVTIRVTMDISLDPEQDPTESHIVATCDLCGWSDAYDNEDSAKRALRLHKSRYCEKTLNVDWIRDMHSEDTQT